MNLKLDYRFKICKGNITRLELAELEPAVSCSVFIHLSSAAQCAIKKHLFLKQLVVLIQRMKDAS